MCKTPKIFQNATSAMSKNNPFCGPDNGSDRVSLQETFSGLAKELFTATKVSCFTNCLILLPQRNPHQISPHLRGFLLPSLTDYGFTQVGVSFCSNAVSFFENSAEMGVYLQIYLHWETIASANCTEQHLSDACLETLDCLTWIMKAYFSCAQPSKRD